MISGSSLLFSFCSVLMPLRSKLRLKISNLPRKPTAEQQLKISRSLAYLGKQVKDFLDRASSFLPTIEETDLKPLDDELIDTPLEESVEPEEAMEVTPEEDLFYEEDETQAPSILPEEVVLPLPSNIISAKIRLSFKCLMELRKGQANDALEGLQIGLANKSLLLQTNVNQSTSTKQRSTRAWASVRNTQSQILLHA